MFWIIFQYAWMISIALPLLLMHQKTYKSTIKGYQEILNTIKNNSTNIS